MPTPKHFTGFPNAHLLLWHTGPSGSWLPPTPRTPPPPARRTAPDEDPFHQACCIAATLALSFQFPMAQCSWPPRSLGMPFPAHRLIPAPPFSPSLHVTTVNLSPVPPLIFVILPTHITHFLCSTHHGGCLYNCVFTLVLAACLPS